MKTKTPFPSHSFGGIISAAAILFMAANVSAQNLFIANYPNGTIQEISGGAESIFATGMNYPAGVAFDGAGDLFVANSANNAGESGNITEFTHTGSSVFASGIDPQGLAFDGSGDLFVADYRSGNIYEYTPKGVQSTFATGFSIPVALTFDSHGDLFVGGGGNNGAGYITEITPTKTQTAFATGLNLPAGLAFNSGGNLFESDNGSGNVYEFSQTGRSTVTSLNAPNGLAFDSAGDLYVAASDGSITEITTKGVQSTVASLSGVPDGIAFQPVPEPSARGLIGVGAILIFGFRNWKRMNSASV